MNVDFSMVLPTISISLRPAQSRRTIQFPNPRHGCRTFCAGSTSRAGIGSLIMTTRSDGKPSMPAVMTRATAQSVAYKLRSMTQKAGSHECWTWLGMKRKGYGWLKLDNARRQMVLVHRVSFALNNGDLLNGECVRHTCDNPSCVNPKHLISGSRADNMADCMERNRHAKGVDIGHSKLFPEAVADIRAHYIYRKIPLRIFAERYGVGTSAVKSALDGDTWRSVA